MALAQLSDRRPKPDSAGVLEDFAAMTGVSFESAATSRPVAPSGSTPWCRHDAMRAASSRSRGAATSRLEVARPSKEHAGAPGHPGLAAPSSTFRPLTRHAFCTPGGRAAARASTLRAASSRGREPRSVEEGRVHAETRARRGACATAMGGQLETACSLAKLRST